MTATFLDCLQTERGYDYSLLSFYKKLPILYDKWIKNGHKPVSVFNLVSHDLILKLITNEGVRFAIVPRCKPDGQVRKMIDIFDFYFNNKKDVRSLTAYIANFPLENFGKEQNTNRDFYKNGKRFSSQMRLFSMSKFKSFKVELKFLDYNDRIIYLQTKDYFGMSLKALKNSEFCFDLQEKRYQESRLELTKKFKARWRMNYEIMDKNNGQTTTKMSFQTP